MDYKDKYKMWCWEVKLRYDTWCGVYQDSQRRIKKG